MRPIQMLRAFAFNILLFAFLASALAPTDEIMDCDTAQSGYLDNHKLSPDIVNDPGFGILWQISTNGGSDELFFAKPLVYTPASTGRQVVIAASAKNWVYIIDANNGTILASRQLAKPFKQADIGCTDVQPYIGIMGTPVIDPGSDTIYLFSKSYADTSASGAEGVANGRYRVYALSALDLTNRPGYPIVVDGTQADNDPAKYFMGGTHMQRPSLAMINNYTGWVMGSFAGGSGGGGAGIWQAGTFEECIISFKIDPQTKKATPQDFFQPYEYLNLDMTDKDFGSSGLTLLDPGTFTATGISRMGVTGGKNGKIYLVNADDLGGGSIFGGIGSYPKEGGYIYAASPNWNIVVYSFGKDSAGKPVFTQVGMTAEKNAQRVGTGIPTITSMGGAPGSAILWLTDVDNGLRAWKAVPNADGAPINLPLTSNIAISSFKGLIISPGIYFHASNSSVSGISLAKGSNVTIPVTLDLTSSSGYTSQQPVTLSVNIVSSAAFLQVQPLEVSFGGVVFGSQQQTDGVSSSIYIKNIGTQPQWTTIRPPTGGGLWYINDGFEAEFPAKGSTIAGGSSVAVTLNFQPTHTGDFSTWVAVKTSAGYAIFVMSGTSSTAPLGTLQMLTSEGGVINNKFYDFGSITKSKPPGQPELYATHPGDQFTENQMIAPGKNATGSVAFAPFVRSLVNQDPQTYTDYWVLNTNGDNFGGPYDVKFTGTVVTKQVGPLYSNGTGRYKYLGCYIDSTNGVRIAPNKYTFQEYAYECWCGNSVPDASFKKADDLCVTQCPGDKSQSCGGDGGYGSAWYDSSRYDPSTNLLDGVLARPPSFMQTAGGFTFVGCWSDSTGNRSLKDKTTANNNINITSCASTCAGYTYMATSYGNESDMYSFCGAASRLSLYVKNGTSLPSTSTSAMSSTTSTSRTSSAVTTATTTRTSTTSATSTASGLANWDYTGCWTDNVADRSLQDLSYNAADNSLQKCATFCAGYKYFGVEYSSECYCGNNLGGSSALEADCYKTCSGSNETCGGDNRLNVYSAQASVTTSDVPSSPSSWDDMGCYKDFTGDRALLGKVTTSTNNSAASCFAFCNSYGFLYFGTEYANECYCGNAIVGAGKLVNNHDNVDDIKDVKHYIDNNDYHIDYKQHCIYRALAGWGLDPSSDMTVEKCLDYCSNKQYVGVEDGRECWCGDIFPNGQAAVNTECNEPCSGASNENCGGPQRLAIYHKVSNNPAATSTTTGTTTSAVTTAAGGPTIVASYKGFVYQSCWTDLTANRTLGGWGLDPSNDMTVEKCIDACASTKQYAGLEDSRECWCGSEVLTGESASDSECKAPCGGAPGSACGGPSRLVLYKKDPTWSSTSTSTTSTGVNNLLTPTTTSTTSRTSSTSSTSISTSTTTSGSSTTTTTTSSSSRTTTLSSSTSSSSSRPTSSTTPSTTFTTATTTTTSRSSSTNSTTTSTTFSSSRTTTTTTTTTPSSATTTTTTTKSPTTTTTTTTTTTIRTTTTITTGTTTITTMSTTTVGSPPNGSPQLWQPKGCFIDSVNSRTLPNKTRTLKDTMTVENCQDYCMSTFNLPLAGLESGKECYCGDRIPSGLQGDQTGCTMACSGDNTETCGGSRRLDVYQNRDWSATIIQQSVLGWNYIGCWTETSPTRAISAFRPPSSTSMTTAMCITTCREKGYTFAGLQNGSECYCGSSKSAASQSAPDEQCNFNCPGNVTEFCGAPNRLQVYTIPDGNKEPPLQPSKPGATVPKFTLPASYTRTFNVKKDLGEGSFGETALLDVLSPPVEPPLPLHAGQIIVVKRVRELRVWRTEWWAMRAVSGHENVVQGFGVAEDDGFGVTTVVLLNCGKYLTSTPTPSPRLSLRLFPAAQGRRDNVRGAPPEGFATPPSDWRTIVHNDIKPDNIFMVSRAWGDPCIYPIFKIADFGGATDLTSIASVGSTMTSSPERVTKLFSVASTPHDDIFSLGATMYYLSHGRNPFPSRQFLHALHTSCGICGGVSTPAPTACGKLPHMRMVPHDPASLWSGCGVYVIPDYNLRRPTARIAMPYAAWWHDLVDDCLEVERRDRPDAVGLAEALFMARRGCGDGSGGMREILWETPWLSDEQRKRGLHVQSASVCTVV
ncbi:hypothetical protein Dda_6382 [Drechslerella dactyloides]|uniref:Uncharacterized protein n=1 Tax=Drechslerella dactyloides TaxID=74499 RepID=A0AAD6IXQ8_DREDA|nr:hypothetical protein Dda_6382 [Drechslerella dactyloides]